MRYRRKMFWIVLAAALTSSSLCTFLTYASASRILLDQVASKLLSIATTTATLFDGDAQKQILSATDESSPQYRQLSTFLRRARDANRRDDVHVRFMGTVVKKPGTSNLTYGVDPEETFVEHLHPGEAYKPDSEPFNIGMTRTDKAPERDDEGTWLNAYAPIRDSSGSVVGELEVEGEAANFWKPRDLLALRSFGIFSTVSLVMLMVAWMISNRMGKPLDALIDASRGYVPEPVINSILRGEEPQLKGERKRVTVLFADIRDFTKISESMRPERAVALLGEFLEIMVEIVLRNEGFIDKFMGDGLMAIFGAPLDDQYQEEHAITAALEMQTRARVLRDEWEAQGRPPLRIGIGVNSGPAIVGNIGSRQRFEYTAIGDTVNVASRLENATKVLGVDILISEDTYHPARPAFSFVKTGPIEVRGRTEPVVTYSVRPADAGPGGAAIE